MLSFNGQVLLNTRVEVHYVLLVYMSMCVPMPQLTQHFPRDGFGTSPGTVIVRVLMLASAVPVYRSVYTR